MSIELLQMIVNGVLTLLLPVMVCIAWYLSYVLVQRLAMHQRIALEQFARMAVQRTEQEAMPTDAGQTKKALAVATTVELFKSFGLPTPEAGIIDIAIESAVFTLKRK